LTALKDLYRYCKTAILAQSPPPPKKEKKTIKMRERGGGDIYLQLFTTTPQRSICTSPKVKQ